MNTVKIELSAVHSFTLTSQRKCLLHNTYNIVSPLYVEVRTCKKGDSEQHEFYIMASSSILACLDLLFFSLMP